MEFRLAAVAVNVLRKMTIKMCLNGNNRISCCRRRRCCCYCYFFCIANDAFYESVGISGRCKTDECRFIWLCMCQLSFNCPNLMREHFVLCDILPTHELITVISMFTAPVHTPLELNAVGVLDAQESHAKHRHTHWHRKYIYLFRWLMLFIVYHRGVYPGDEALFAFHIACRCQRCMLFVIHDGFAGTLRPSHVPSFFVRWMSDRMCMCTHFFLFSLRWME